MSISRYKHKTTDYYLPIRGTAVTAVLQGHTSACRAGSTIGRARVSFPSNARVAGRAWEGRASPRSPPNTHPFSPFLASLSSFSTMSTAECIASANDLLAAHSALINRVRLNQKAHRRQLRALPSPPQAILSVPLIPSPQPSPPPSRSPSPNLPPKPKAYRPDLPAAKRARLARYDNYVPEEETIRNDYSQRYVDGGEWPQNWVLGADPERRFEECVLFILGET